MVTAKYLIKGLRKMAVASDSTLHIAPLPTCGVCKKQVEAIIKSFDDFLNSYSYAVHCHGAVQTIAEKDMRVMESGFATKEVFVNSPKQEAQPEDQTDKEINIAMMIECEACGWK